MTLIRTQTEGYTPCITDSNQLVIIAEHVVLYEPSTRLYWATQEKYEEDMERTGSNRCNISEYEHAKIRTRVVFVTGREYHILQSFESFDRAFTSAMERR